MTILILSYKKYTSYSHFNEFISIFDYYIKSFQKYTEIFIKYQAKSTFDQSVGEVEIVISIVIIVSLPKERSNCKNSKWKPQNSNPFFENKIYEESLNDEFIKPTIKKVKQPLLSCVRSVMPDCSSHISFFLIDSQIHLEGSPLRLCYSQTQFESMMV